MSFRQKLRCITFVITPIILFHPLKVTAQEIFIYRPYLEKDSISFKKKVTVHGDYFGYLIFPGNFPGYTDLSGEEDRFNLGFQNILFLGQRTRFIGQLLTHDDGRRRTKFDWHFSLRHTIFDNLVFVLGHDSNHDSDHQSTLNQKKYFVNRNYFGLGIPFTVGRFYIEPFTWFFHHSNQRSHLDSSGDKMLQEFGFRVGTWIEELVGISFQWIAQSQARFSTAQAYRADLVIRVKLMNYLEFSAGTWIWRDIQESPKGNKQQFYSIFWGIAIPF